VKPLSVVHRGFGRPEEPPQPMIVVPPNLAKRTTSMLKQTDNTPTVAAAPAMTAATRAVLIALRATLGDDTRLPPGLPMGQAAAVLIDIHKEHATATWNQLVHRYGTVELRSRDLNLAIVRATGWVLELIDLVTDEPHRPGHTGHDLAVTALVAALARRFVVDGIECATKTVDACAQRILAAEKPRSVPVRHTTQGAA